MHIGSPNSDADRLEQTRWIAGRYRLQRALGRGGMASVWSVYDEVAGRPLALKRLASGAPETHVELFEREYHTLATLRHPCIIEAYDYASDEDGPFYTMELLAGSDVSKLAPMPYGEVCRVLRDVASALALLQARRLLHRDLSARNVWRMPDGRIRLIDFGTVTSFGKTLDVAGTPPYIAPECVDGSYIDQRADLYALGALGYFLLCGRHAIEARTLAELSCAWRKPVRAIAARVAALGRTDLPELPSALDQLIAALLSRDPLARPTGAADVIDRLTVIGGLPELEPVRVAQSYLQRPVFVGRALEREALRDARTQAALGRPATFVVESAEGCGRSRLLSELALESRLTCAAVLEAEPRADHATHDNALDYALALLAALPTAALAAAQPYLPVLGRLAPALRERLHATTLAPMPEVHGEARMRIQTALRAWFLDVARDHLLVLIADDFDQFDAASAAFLTTLARAASEHKLLIVASVRDDRAPSAVTAALQQTATRLHLSTLSPGELAQLFRSIFGDVPHLARFTDQLSRHSEGNPSHALDLAEHLSREGAVTCADGAWVLPPSLAPDALPANRAGAELARLSRLTPLARALGQVLSIREGALPLALCSALSEAKGAGFFAGLEVLVREGVLIAAASGYRFTRESLRRQLDSELRDRRRKRAHRKLGQLLFRAPELSQLERLKAGVHLLLGGQEELGSRAVAQAAKHYGLVDLADLAPAVPALTLALEHFRQTGRSRYEQISLLAALAIAGYYADRQLAVRYGASAVATLAAVTGLDPAPPLRRWLGPRLSLIAALSTAGLGFALRAGDSRVPTFREALMLLFNCVAALTGVCTIGLEPEAAAHYAAVIEPLTALGPKHVATFMHRFCLNLVATLSDQPARARAQWLALIAQLDDPDTLRELPAHLHALYLGGALYALGVIECWRDDSAALDYAKRLESLNLKLYDVSADQVRMLYYANRGDLMRFEHFRQRVELHAIQQGTAWQVETWASAALITVYLRTGNVAGLKACVKQLRHLSAETPSLGLVHTRALAAYLVARGSPTDALAVIDTSEIPRALIGWTLRESVRARAYNALGQHEQARAICLAGSEQRSAEDRAFCALQLGLDIELARARAALGEHEQARTALSTLLELHAPNGNPLTLGALHESLAELATARKDPQAFARHASEVARYFRPLRDPALSARCERLLRSTPPLDRDPTDDADAEPSQLTTVVRRP